MHAFCLCLHRCITVCVLCLYLCLCVCLCLYRFVSDAYGYVVEVNLINGHLTVIHCSSGSHLLTGFYMSVSRIVAQLSSIMFNSCKRCIPELFLRLILLIFNVWKITPFFFLLLLLFFFFFFFLSFLKQIAVLITLKIDYFFKKKTH